MGADACEKRVRRVHRCIALVQCGTTMAAGGERPNREQGRRGEKAKEREKTQGGRNTQGNSLDTHLTTIMGVCMVIYPAHL